MGRYLTSTEVSELFARYAKSTGEERERLEEEIFLAYQSFAISRVQRFDNHPEYDDLIAEAFAGLLDAIRRFDRELGYPFIGFASATVDGSLKRWFRDKSRLIHVQRRLTDGASQAKELESHLTERLCRPPTDEELAAFMEISVEDLREIKIATTVSHAYSLDFIITEAEPGKDVPLQDVVGDDGDDFEVVDHQHQIQRLLEGLPERERRLVTLYYLEGKTQQEISSEVGISQMHVSRLLTRAMEELKSWAAMGVAPTPRTSVEPPPEGLARSKATSDPWQWLSDRSGVSSTTIGAVFAADIENVQWSDAVIVLESLRGGPPEELLDRTELLWTAQKYVDLEEIRRLERCYPLGFKSPVENVLSRLGFESHPEIAITHAPAIEVRGLQLIPEL